VSVLQDYKLVRPMDLEDLFHDIRDLAAMRYLGIRTKVHNNYTLSRAEMKVVQATQVEERDVILMKWLAG
jgi:hypothetical protein